MALLLESGVPAGPSQAVCNAHITERWLLTDGPCPHPERKGHHEVYAGGPPGMGGTDIKAHCRACGAISMKESNHE